MALSQLGFVPLWSGLTGNVFLSSLGAAVNIAASTHWVGWSFYAGATDTITKVYFLTSTVTSPVFQLEAAITALDANGFPLGADIAVSSTTATNPTATTQHALDISASVTKGTMYGLIIRVKSGTYTSGSANVYQRAGGPAVAAATNWGPYCASRNVGANAKDPTPGSMVAVKYSGGWAHTPGLGLPVTGVALRSTSATSGNAQGNKFTLRHHLTVFGYLVALDQDNPANVEMYAGSDNTAIAGSSVALTAAYRAVTNENTSLIMLPTPVVLTPGTYRVGLRNTSAAANGIFDMTGLPEAGAAVAVDNGLADVMKTVYSGGAWTDTNTALSAIMPLVGAVDDGRPMPSLFIGGLN